MSENKFSPLDKQTFEKNKDNILLENYKDQNDFLKSKTINLINLVNDNIQSSELNHKDDLVKFLDKITKDEKKVSAIEDKEKLLQEKLPDFDYKKLNDFNLDCFIKPDLHVKDFTTMTREEKDFLKDFSSSKLTKKEILNEYNKILPDDYLLTIDQYVPDHIKLELVDEFKNNLKDDEKIKIINKVKSLNDNYSLDKDFQKHLSPSDIEYTNLLNSNIIQKYLLNSDINQKEETLPKRSFYSLIDNYEQSNNQPIINNNNLVNNEFESNQKDINHINLISDKAIDNNQENKIENSNYVNNDNTNVLNNNLLSNEFQSNNQIDGMNMIDLSNEQLDKNQIDKKIDNNDSESPIKKLNINELYSNFIAKTPKENLIKSDLLSNEEMNSFINVQNSGSINLIEDNDNKVVLNSNDNVENVLNDVHDLSNQISNKDQANIFYPSSQTSDKNQQIENYEINYENSLNEVNSQNSFYDLSNQQSNDDQELLPDLSNDAINQSESVDYIDINENINGSKINSKTTNSFIINNGIFFGSEENDLSPNQILSSQTTFEDQDIDNLISQDSLFKYNKKFQKRQDEELKILEEQRKYELDLEDIQIYDDPNEPNNIDLNEHSKNNESDSFFLKEKIWNPVFVANEMPNDQRLSKFQKQVDDDFIVNEYDSKTKDKNENISVKEIKYWNENVENQDWDNDFKVDEVEENKKKIFNKFIAKPIKNNLEDQDIPLKKVLSNDAFESTKAKKDSPKFNEEIKEILKKDIKI